MKKYVFYRDKKIAWMLFFSYFISIFINFIIADSESTGNLYTSGGGVAVFIAAIYLLTISGIVYKSVAVYIIDSSGISFGILFRKKILYSEIAQIRSSEKYLTFVAFKNGRKVYLNISIYILFANIDLYTKFFKELMSKIDINDISIDKKSKQILSGERLLTIQSLNTPDPKIGGWILYFTISIIAMGFVELVSLPDKIHQYNAYFAGDNILQAVRLIKTIFLIIIAVCAPILIFRKRKITPTVLISKEWIEAFFGIFFAVMAIIAGAKSEQEAYWLQYVSSVLSIANAVLWALVYTRYYKISIRVRKTFGAMSDEEYKTIFGDYTIYEDSDADQKASSDNASNAEVDEEFGPKLETGSAAHIPEIKLKDTDLDVVKDFFCNMTDEDNQTKITFHFFGKVKYYLAKQWYRKVKEALIADHMAINKIVASPDHADKKYMGYKPSDEYEEIYFEQMFTDIKGVQFKYLGFLCAYDESNDYISDSHCFGEMSWGDNLYLESMKLSFDKKTASKVNIYKYVELFNKYISLRRLHVYEIDYRKDVRLVNSNGDFVEDGKSKKLILDLGI